MNGGSKTLGENGSCRQCQALFENIVKVLEIGNELGKTSKG